MHKFSKIMMVTILSVSLASTVQAQSPKPTTNPNITTGPGGVKTVTGGGAPGTPPAAKACKDIATALGVPNLDGCTPVPIGAPGDGTVAILGPNGKFCYFDPTAKITDQQTVAACNSQFPTMGQ